MIINSRGSAMLEAVPVTLVLLAFVSGLLLAAYLLFARAWIQYQSEQALYCAAVESPGCRRQLEDQVRRFIPWGNISSDVHSSGTNWSAEVRWNYQDYSFRVAKDLTPRLILKNRALLW